MAKLQQITRANGSRTHSITLPLELVEELNWSKGDNLEIKTFTEGESHGIKILEKQE